MTTSPPAEPSGSLSANSIQEAHTEPTVNESPSLTPVLHTERTVNMSPAPASPPPNDASVVLLLAAAAKRDSELEMQLKISKLAKPVPDLHLTPAEKLSPVNRLVLRFHQELQDQHGLPVDPAISEQYVMTPWKFGKTWGVRVSPLRASYWISNGGHVDAKCFSSPSLTWRARP